MMDGDRDDETPAEAPAPADEALEQDSQRARAATVTAGFAPTTLGWLTNESAHHALVVDFFGNAAGPRPARAVVVLDEATLARAVATRQPVALAFENGDPRLPIILGLVQDPPSPLRDLLGAPPPAAEAAPRPLEAKVDGKRVVFRADDEITLECGAASLTLRRDGKILLRGAYVETYAEGTNRIKGAAVKIN